MLAKHVLLNKNMFVLTTDEKNMMMVLLKVMWFLTLAVDILKAEVAKSLNDFIRQIRDRVNWVTKVMTT